MLPRYGCNTIFAEPEIIQCLLSERKRSSREDTSTTRPPASSPPGAKPSSVAGQKKGESLCKLLIAFRMDLKHGISWNREE